jgi:hypothetical protein
LSSPEHAVRRAPASLSLTAGPAWQTHARGQELERAAPHVVGHVFSRASPVTNKIYFIFIYSVTVLDKFWKNVNLGFYLPKNYEINFVRIYMMCSILEKYELVM